MLPGTAPGGAGVAHNHCVHQSQVRIAIAATGQTASQIPQLMHDCGTSTISIPCSAFRHSVGQMATQSPHSVHDRESISGNCWRGTGGKAKGRRKIEERRIVYCVLTTDY